MNFSISEILVVLLIALLVIKPEQMPEAIQLFTRCLKTIRSLIRKVKDEMNDLVLDKNIEGKK